MFRLTFENVFKIVKELMVTFIENFQINLSFYQCIPTPACKDVPGHSGHVSGG